jgi:type I restriction enzyme M protein
LADKLDFPTLKSVIDDAADVLRKSLNAPENYKIVLCLLFLKRLNDNFITEAEKLMKTKKLSKEEAYENRKRHTFFVPKDGMYVKLEKAGDDVGAKIIKVCHEIEKYNDKLEGTLVNAEFNNKKKYSDDSLRKLIKIFLPHNFSDDNSAEGDDLFGDAYEYLLEEYAGETKKKGGQFYTPRQVIRTMVKIVKPKQGMQICDPTCGSGGMLIQSRKYIEENNKNADLTDLTLHGQDSNPDTVNLCKMNLVVHGITEFEIKDGDTLNDPKLVKGGKLETYDRVLANFPFSENWDSTNAAKDPYGRFEFGIPPEKDKADFAFIQHMYASLNETGQAAIVASQGVLFRGSEEQKIREGLISKDRIEAIIALPEKIFFGTPIPGCILILNNKKPKNRKDKILFIYAAGEKDYEKNSKRNLLRDKDIKKIVDAFEKYEDADRYCHVADLEELKENEYNLNVPRYVDISEPEEIIDIQKTIDELKKLDKERGKLECKVNADLKELGFKI